MKKKSLAILIIVMTMGMLMTGCGQGDGPSSPVSGLDPKPVQQDEPSSAEPSSGEQSNDPGQDGETAPNLISGGEKHPIGERVIVDGKMQSWLTGEWKDADVAQRRNMAVMINNIKVSLPQYGISQASVVYEAPVEGRITRLMGYFEDYDDLDHIGSVRSSRDYFVFEAIAFDSIYCNWGLAQAWVEVLLKDNTYVDVDNVSQAVAGIYNPSPEAFDRIPRQGVALEHTGHLFIEGYNKAVKRLGYKTEYRNAFVKAFEFADEGYLATYDDCEDAVKIYPGGTQSNAGGYGKHNPCFTYDPEDRLYYRTQYGQEHIDEMTGEQLAVTNVIFKVCNGRRKEPNKPSSDYLEFDTVGKGEAYIFTNGKVIEGTWKRDDNSHYTKPTIYYDKDGNEIVLNQGKTWICCIWSDYKEYMEWK